MQMTLSFMDLPKPEMQYSDRYDMLVYDKVRPEIVQTVLNICPEAKGLPDGRFAVKASLSNLQTMRRFNLPVINIVDKDYAYPGIFKPFDHQRTIAGFLAVHPRCLNLSDIGTGKTLSTLWGADYLMNKGVIKRALIISTLSTLQETWADTIFKNFMGKRTALVLNGTPSRRINVLNTKADFYIINHDGLGVGYKRDGRRLQLGELVSNIIDRQDIDCVIVDEATAYKNSGTVRFRILRALLDKKPYAWLLSGAPTPNSPTDAWALRRLIDPTLRQNFYDFRDTVMHKTNQFRWEPNDSAAHTVARFLQPAIRFNREDCLDLPDCLVERRKVSLSENQKKAYKQLKQDMVLQLENGVVNAVNEISLRAKLIQIASGAVYGENKQVNPIDVAPRINALYDVLEEAQGKVIVFSTLTSVVNLLEEELKDQYKLVKVMGETKNRGDIFRAFQEDDSIRVMVANPSAMAHGVTLTSANTVVWFGPTDNPETYTQANGRINRPGQKRNMLVVQIFATPIEKEIFDRLETKQNLQGIILDLVKEGMTNAND
jgi:SNF2 family DNA or RNA helicase